MSGLQILTSVGDLPVGAKYYFTQINTLAVYTATEAELPLIVPVGPYQMQVEISGILSDYSSNTKTVVLPIVPCIPRLESNDTSKANLTKLSVYPNPALNQFTIMLELPADSKTVPVVWELKNLFGSIVQTGVGSASGGSSSIPVSLRTLIADGVYLLQVQAGNDRLYSSISFNH